MRKILNIVFNRVVLVLLVILVQLAVLIGIMSYFQQYMWFVFLFGLLLSVAIVVRVINSRRNPTYKLAWVVLVMLDPYLGALLYLIFGRVRVSEARRKHKEEVIEKALQAGARYRSVHADSLREKDPLAFKQAHYMETYAHSPLFQNTDTEYFAVGEDMFERMKEEMRKAKRYIFFEYFIIAEGYMWDSLLEIMKQKAEEGVDVRVVYDGVGSSFTLPPRYSRKLEQMGIKCGVFRPFVPVLSSQLNNRSHRKCLIIDGITAFTGGVNISDEYINHKEVFGHWKDTAVMMKGDGAWGFAVQFLAQWDYIRGEEKEYDFYRPDEEYVSVMGGYTQPHADDPLESERVGSTVYINMISAAQKYLYVYTPYLIINNEMLEAFCIAAKNGVDVRIMTPYVRDKWFVHPVTQSFYEQLIENGVKIFEYTPGFLHAKSFVCDDKYGVVGTVNLDYRSLYLHLECGVWLYNTQCVAALRDDFLATQAVSREVTLEWCRQQPWSKKLGASILRLFAPLM